MKTMNSTTADDSFIVTKEYRRFHEFCDACRRDRYIGICYGPAGVGKTLSARRYAQWDTFKALEKLGVKERIFQIPPSFKDSRTIFHTSKVVNSPIKTMNSIHTDLTLLHKIAYAAEMSEKINENDYEEDSYHTGWLRTFVDDSIDYFELLIVDEADRLKVPTIEEIRDFYDRNNCGVVLIGMPGIEKKLSRYPQLYSRIGFAHEFRQLSSQEMLFIMENYFKELNVGLKPNDFTDHEAITAIANTTRGNFRLFRRLFTQIKRIMQINNTSTVTKEIVYAARECLVIGL
ncbi:MAG: AAA family ATPase [Simkaniaceae bacterium]